VAILAADITGQMKPILISEKCDVWYILSFGSNYVSEQSAIFNMPDAEPFLPIHAMMLHCRDEEANTSSALNVSRLSAVSISEH
jgi:hypothetical protein